MDDWTIVETFTLPSSGKIYGKQVNPDIKLRSMTTNDEMSRLNTSSKKYKKMCDLIDNCIIGDKPGISSYDMCLGDYQYLLHSLRIVTYGPDYKLACQCPYCRETRNYDVPLDQLELRKDIDEFNNHLNLVLPRTKKKITLNYQTPRMLDLIEEDTQEFRRKSQNGIDRGLLLTMQYLINTVDGKALSPLDAEDFCNNLPMMDTNYILKYAEKLNNYIGLDTSIDVDCEVCGNHYRTMFRQTREFFGPDIDI